MRSEGLPLFYCFLLSSCIDVLYSLHLLYFCAFLSILTYLSVSESELSVPESELSTFESELSVSESELSIPESELSVSASELATFER